ncbi:amino acid deaminase [Bowmanella sp. Y26]|uniref:amino acid deaminase n=1 Tax=Bowmanella yangjiangensis TaxID=2811230 RepID=UPI001BDC1C98|nr:amino acid deaminase [Bowmanella yangjiangensis]MBT1063562.1 amino acid deaminase [Bowmanella yangjiangensis]
MTLSSNKVVTFSKGQGDAELLQQGWSLLEEDVSLPVAVLSRSALQNNLSWMKNYAQQTGVRLAPHGKTSMAPALFAMQIEAGSWAMSLATAPQVVAAARSGIKRILMANQLVGKRNMQLIAEQIRSGLEFFCFVDSIANADALSTFFSAQNLQLNLLLEIGVPQGRCGVRSIEQANALCEQINALPALDLRGIAFYEGVIHGPDAPARISEFVSGIRTLALNWREQKRFAEGEIILTGAGSAWYDIVAEQMDPINLPDNVAVVIRPGCYLIHDTGIYQDAQAEVKARSRMACDIKGDLISSLQVWAYVQSIPEPGMAVIGLGKRDAAFDAGLPTPVLHHRPGDTSPSAVPSHWKLTRIMDQHAMLQVNPEDELTVGDILCFSTSHPCLTMDKWRYLGIVDDDYCVRQLIETCF